MTVKDVYKLIDVGRKPIIINREKLDKYGAIYREIGIISEQKIRIDFNDCIIGDPNREGGLSVSFEFFSFDNMIYSIEKFILKKISQWKHFNYSIEPSNEHGNWEMFKNDFYCKKIKFPSLFDNMSIGDYYWMALYNGYVKPNSSIEEINNWFKEFIKSENK